MPTTPNKGFSVPTTGTEEGTWGADLNTNTFAVIDNNLGGLANIGLTNANVTLTAAQSQMAILRLTGILTANVTVTTAAIGFFMVENLTTGNFTVILTNGTGASVIVPQTSRVQVISDATNGLRCLGVGFQPGDFRPTMANTAAALGGEWLFCDGSTLQSTSFPLLAAILGAPPNGTFTLPDLRGRVPAGRDNMGNNGAAGRLTAANGLDGTILGTGGGAQTVSLTADQNGPHEHDITDPGHPHTYIQVVVNGGTFITPLGGGAVSLGDLPTATSTEKTGITINSSGTGAAHPNVQPTFVCNWLVKT